MVLFVAGCVLLKYLKIELGDWGVLLEYLKCDDGYECAVRISQMRVDGYGRAVRISQMWVAVRGCALALASYATFTTTDVVSHPCSAGQLKNF